MGKSSNNIVSINLVVHNRGPWLQRVLASIRAQTYPNIEINEFDGTTDNIGFWAGQEKLLPQSKGKYIICMTDVVLDPNFVKNAVETMERDERIGALQAKILQGSHQLSATSPKLIDTTGFQISRSRRIINRGHGEPDRGQCPAGEVFAVEGAVPVFRREALEDCRMSDGWIIDPDFRMGPLGYGDDLDLAWRMHVLGWKQWYDPRVIAFHDRSTSHDLAHHWYDSLGLERIMRRRNIPIRKRQLDWLNTRFTIIKNDYIVSILRDALFIITREFGVLLYMLIIEPSVFRMVPRFFRLLPRMIRRRREIMRRARINAIHFSRPS